MGGRGTFAIGKPVPYTYETVGFIEGIKVLKGKDGVHGLPEEAHSSSAYISLYPNGTVKQIRVFNPDLTAKVDIEFSMHQGKLTLHAHDYANGERKPARLLTHTEQEHYKRFFGGKK